MHFPPPPPPPPQATWNGPTPSYQNGPTRPQYGQRHQNQGGHWRGNHPRGRGGRNAGTFNAYNAHNQRSFAPPIAAGVPDVNFANASQPRWNGYGGQASGQNFAPAQQQRVQTQNHLSTQAGAQEQAWSGPRYQNAHFLSRSTPGPNSRQLNTNASSARFPTPKGQVPPSVPSFGGPILQPPAASSAQPRKQGVEKGSDLRNILGLTPHLAQDEASETGAADEDEESTWASKRLQSGSLQHLEISYNGKTSTLQTASDIAAWIAERKKRFPTKARIAERSSRNQHTNKPGGSKSKLPPRHDGEANPNARAIKRQKIESDRADKNRKDKGEEAGDALSKARSRMEKLRRQMAREEDRISKIAAKASSGKERETRNDSKEKTSLQAADLQPKLLISFAHAQSADTSKSAIAGVENPGSNTADVDTSLSESDGTSTESEDMTSSSGTSDSEDDSNSDVPEEMSSKKFKPAKMVSNQDAKPRGICQRFLKTGRCRLGKSCRYSHKKPQRDSDKRTKTTNGVDESRRKQSRISLHERLVQQEQKQQERDILEAIVSLGDAGYLDSPSS